MAIGLYSMSEARMFSSQATSSRALMRMASHPASRTVSRSQRSFSSRVSPARMRKIGVCGIPGLSSHSTERRSGTPTTLNDERRDSTASALWQRESTGMVKSHYHIAGLSCETGEPADLLPAVCRIFALVRIASAHDYGIPAAAAHKGSEGLDTL